MTLYWWFTKRLRDEEETDDYLGRGDNHEKDKKKAFVFNIFVGISGL